MEACCCGGDGKFGGEEPDLLMCLLPSVQQLVIFASQCLVGLCEFVKRRFQGGILHSKYLQLSEEPCVRSLSINACRLKHLIGGCPLILHLHPILLLGAGQLCAAPGYCCTDIRLPRTLRLGSLFLAVSANPRSGGTAARTVDMLPATSAESMPAFAAISGFHAYSCREGGKAT